MTEQASEILKKALALPENERADLASSLIESLDPTVEPDVEAAWQEEIARRMEELRAGRAQTVPWNEVRVKAQAILHEETH